MPQKTSDKNDLIQTLLTKCDHLYQEKRQLQSKYDQQLSEQEAKILELEQQVAYLKRRIFGKSSERFIPKDPLQRKLDFEGMDLLPEEEEFTKDAVEEIQEHQKKAKREKIKASPKRQPLPKDLPREDVHLYPENNTVCDEKEWTELPSEISEILEYKPGRFWVKRIIRHKYARKDKSQVLTAPTVNTPLAKSYASASLLAELMIGKYVDHLPFHRQIKIFKRIGISLAPATINGWFKATADLLRPLYFRLREVILQSDYLQVDETTLPIVREEKHKTVKGYIWMLRSVPLNQIFFHYDQGSRAQKVILPLLKDFQGALQTDGYSVYAMYENKKGVLPLGCWAHARRKFEEALNQDKARASYALTQIGMLYEVERRADREELSYQERAELRTRLSYPILVAFEKWLVKEYPQVLPKSGIGKAIKYTYEIYHKLSRYHLDGRYCIDNNLAENAIRPLALGRKNYLFCGNDDAAEDAAVLYSFMGCCQAAKVDFREWMVDVLNRIHSYDNDYSKDLADFLPMKWKENKHISE